MIFNESIHNQVWETKPLSGLGIFNRGKSKHRPRNDKALFLDGKYPLIQTGEIKSANLYIREHKNMYNDFGLKQSKLWDENTLCITIAANIAETALLAYPMCFPDSVVGFKAYPDETSELFMHYVFTYIKKSIQTSASGSIQDNINLEYLKKLKFQIPKKEYQDKIASILSVLDKKIDLNNKINQELESMAKTLYDYWFVQFDFPDAEGKPYKSSGGKMVYSEELKREIPEGWEVDVVGNILDTADKSKKIPSKEILLKGTIPVIDQSTNFICGFTNDKDSLVYTVNPRIIFGDHTRILKFINFDFARGADGTQVLLSKNNCMPQHLFFYSLKSIDLSNYGYARHFKFLKESNIIIPNKNISKRFDDTVKSFYIQIKNNIFETQKLTQLRDWLLPMLMNGQVKVGDASEMVDELMVAEPSVGYGES